MDECELCGRRTGVDGKWTINLCNEDFKKYEAWISENKKLDEIRELKEYIMELNQIIVNFKAKILILETNRPQATP